MLTLELLVLQLRQFFKFGFCIQISLENAWHSFPLCSLLSYWLDSTLTFKGTKRTIETTVSLKCCQAVKIGLGFLAMHIVVIPVGLGTLWTTNSTTDHLQCRSSDSSCCGPANNFNIHGHLLSPTHYKFISWILPYAFTRFYAPLSLSF
jgi:hypothetical protein